MYDYLGQLRSSTNQKSPRVLHLCIAFLPFVPPVTVKQKIHPTSIISGYRLACKEAVKYIQDHLTYKVSPTNLSDTSS